METMYWVWEGAGIIIQLMHDDLKSTNRLTLKEDRAGKGNREDQCSFLKMLNLSFFEIYY
jgi:hypothetical protein